jgi:hypothetical protein
MKKLYLVLTGIAIVAVVVTMTQHSLTTAASTDLISTYVEAPLPAKDVASTLWQQATPVDVPLSSQTIAKPQGLDPTVKSVNIRSLNNGQWIAFLLEWQDKAKNVGGGVSAYRDSVALQFPVQGGQPFICMGLQGEQNMVDILHWRADLQRDIEEGYADIQEIFPRVAMSFYPEPDLVTFRTAEAAGNPLANRTLSTPVEDLHAGGFGALESVESADALGWGQWEEGRWRVIITRPLTSVDPLDAQLQSGQATSLALAAWDGGNQEVDGKKSVSSWINLTIQKAPPPPAPPPAPTPVPTMAPPVPAPAPAPPEPMVVEKGLSVATFIIVIFAVVAIVMGIVIAAYLRLPSRRSDS